MGYLSGSQPGLGCLPALKRDLNTLFFVLFCFFVSALLRDCSLCWDHWNGTRPLHLMRPCLVGLGQVLIWVERQKNNPKVSKINKTVEFKATFIMICVKTV